jgi:hypothetical protein
MNGFGETAMGLFQMHYGAGHGATGGRPDWNIYLGSCLQDIGGCRTDNTKLSTDSVSNSEDSNKQYAVLDNIRDHRGPGHH